MVKKSKSEIQLALIILKLPNGKYVFQRRDGKAPVNPNGLGLFGGHIEKNETPEKAARRELAEETSLDVGNLEFKKIGEKIFNDNGPSRKSFYFLVQINSPDFKVFEGSGKEVYDLSEVLSRDDVNPRTKEIVKSLMVK